MPGGIVEECAVSFRYWAIAVVAGGTMLSECDGDCAGSSLLLQPR